MKAILVLLLAMVLAGCTTEETVVNPPDQITVTDANQDRAWHMPPDSILGLVEFWFLPGTLHGDAILMFNGPGRAVGYDITDAEDRAQVYFGDGYTGAGDDHMEAGTDIPHNRWVYVRVVVYRTLAGWVVAFLDAIGPGFFDHLEETWVEAVYEAEVYFQEGGGLQTSGWRLVSQNVVG